MDGNSTNIGSFYWWMSVVLVGVLINLASAYLKTPLDAILSKVSNRWRLRSEAQRVQRMKAIQALRADLHEQTLMSLSEIGSRVNAVVYLVLALLFFIFVIIANVSPVEDVLWWPFSPSMVPSVKAIHKVAGMTLG